MSARGNFVGGDGLKMGVFGVVAMTASITGSTPDQEAIRRAGGSASCRKKQEVQARLWQKGIGRQTYLDSDIIVTLVSLALVSLVARREQYLYSVAPPPLA